MLHIEIGLFKGLLADIGTDYHKQANIPLVGFLSMKGNKYNNELMVVGRALNGWSTNPFKPQELCDPSYINAVAKETLDSVTDNTGCPMTWVKEAWGRGKKNNTRKSAFWRVIRKVMVRLNIVNENDNDWPSYLVWSNLYKVAPKSGYNPSAALCKLQLKYCRDLLSFEIKTYRPKRVLFLTGYTNWASDFIGDLPNVVNKTSDNRIVEAVGSLNWSEETPGIAVVAVHPQGKKESVWVEAVVNEFSR